MKLRSRIANILHRDIYLVSDTQVWALYWVTHYIQHYLKANHYPRTFQTTTPWELRNQIIHFVDRYMMLDSDYTRLHPSNQLFMTWYHGTPDNPDPNLQRIFQKLPVALPRLNGIVTSCMISYNTLLSVGVPAEKLHIIPIGIDLKHFDPVTPALRTTSRQRFGIPDDALCIGSFQKDGQGWDGEGLEAKLIKGPDVFLEVIAGLKPHYPNLFIFLTGPARGYVKAGLEKIGVPYVHHALDDYQGIGACYHALDLYLITSRDEGGPKALMESWATGIPLVSTRVGQPADYIRPAYNGMLAENEAVNELLEGARQLIEDEALRQRCIQNGLEDVKPLDWEPLTARYFALYAPHLRQNSLFSRSRAT